MWSASAVLPLRGITLNGHCNRYSNRCCGLLFFILFTVFIRVDGLPPYIFPDVVLLKHWLSGVEQTGDERGDDSEIKRRTGRMARTEKEREGTTAHDCNLTQCWAFTQIQQNAKRQKKVERRGGWDIRGLQARRGVVCVSSEQPLGLAVENRR